MNLYGNDGDDDDDDDDEKYNDDDSDKIIMFKLQMFYWLPLITDYKDDKVYDGDVFVFKTVFNDAL